MSNQLSVNRAWLVFCMMLMAAMALGQTADEEPAATAPVEAPTVDMAFGLDVDRATRTLVGEAAEFPADTERVFCFTRISGAEAGTSVTHAWFHEGRTMARVDLAVGSSDWRTWSSKRLLPAWTGTWEVKVLDPAGKVLGSASFVLE